MDKFGIITNGLASKDMDDWRDVYQKVTQTKTALGDPCWGIDIDCYAYNWFLKKIMPVLKNNFTQEMKLIFSSFIRLTHPISMHRDIKDIPKNASGNHYKSILFPYSVDGDKSNFKGASTRFYNERNEVIRSVPWEPNSIIWWDSEILHDSGDFNKSGINYKEYIITHTYV